MLALDRSPESLFLEALLFSRMESFGQFCYGAIIGIRSIVGLFDEKHCSFFLIWNSRADGPMDQMLCKEFYF